jgi:hypothetical protein
LSREKLGDSEPFLGPGYDGDQDWLLTGRPEGLRVTVIELCQQEMRQNAKRSAGELEFPLRNLEPLFTQAAEDEAKEPIGR